MKKAKKLEALKSELFTSTALKNVYGGGWLDDVIKMSKTASLLATAGFKGKKISIKNGMDFVSN